MRVGDLDALEKALECQCNKSWDGALDFDQIKEVIDNAPPVPQVTVFSENADEKAVADLKAELQNVIESRPQGEYIRKEDVIALLNKWADGYSYIEIPTEDAIKAIMEFNPEEEKNE